MIRVWTIDQTLFSYFRFFSFLFARVRAFWKIRKIQSYEKEEYKISIMRSDLEITDIC